MKPSLAQILDEAASWLAVRRSEVRNADELRALDHFEAFLNSISEKDGPLKLEAACGLINHWIVDQIEWIGPTFVGISAHVQHVHQFARDEAQRRYRIPLA